MRDLVDRSFIPDASARRHSVIRFTASRRSWCPDWALPPSASGKNRVVEPGNEGSLLDLGFGWRPSRGRQPVSTLVKRRCATTARFWRAEEVEALRQGRPGESSLPDPKLSLALARTEPRGRVGLGST